MGKQLIITVGREFGSGGHIIAVKLAEHFGIQLLDSNILAEVAKKSNAREEYLKKYDESARNLFFSMPQWDRRRRLPDRSSNSAPVRRPFFLCPDRVRP